MIVLLVAIKSFFLSVGKTFGFPNELVDKYIPKETGYAEQIECAVDLERAVEESLH